MDVTLEQVERLREKANISYEEAKALLEETRGDLLDALILLERQGRAGGGAGGFFTTQPGAGRAGHRRVTPAQGIPGSGGAADGASHDYRARLREIWHTAVNVLRHSTENQFEVWRKGELTTSVPVLILIVLIIVAFWISIPLILLGLVCGCRYRFTGPDLGKESINDAMGTVSETVDDMVDSVKRELRRHRKGR